MPRGFHIESAATAGAGQQECPGCLRDPYVHSRGCSCCLSEQVDRVLVAGQHLMPLCARCYALVRQCRAEAEAEKVAQGKTVKQPRPAPRKRGKVA